ncbi:MAG: hypothetical protein KKG04_07125, partial [Candidatus Thermoplasmatota archaeon]|nr:hypothetical protein [Candidatus Thermoplasmatota archaeon]
MLIPMILTITSNANTVYHQKNIIWDATLDISEPSGIHDIILFGEAPDAGDGTPPDLYDIPKPPLYLPPFIRAWFNDNLPRPYDALSQDYRTFPAYEKTWNLTIQWTPADYTSSTEITISWNQTVLRKSPYKHLMLTNENYTALTDLLQAQSYSFTCPAL